MSDPATCAPWYRDGLCFACTQCGRCCGGAPGYVWVDAAEISAIAASLGLDEQTFRSRHVRRMGLRFSLLEHRDGDCEFLEHVADGQTRCRIHSVRPTQCRTWPFWKSNLASRAAWEATGRNCPGIDAGPRHALPVIQAALAENGRRPL